ncbi:MAG: hypothetical protein CMH52_10275 [Myxococcales bacterium]|nr:hypothetical protein [Myxococcales bacterium]|tara:strand:- start:145 stop:468 length:324 start_codon:yes stop_codon:yes gene_type:complete
MATPLHTVKEQFGSKEALVAKLVPIVERGEAESDADLSERLLRVSNRKLLRLWARQEKLLAGAGSRDALVDKVVSAKLGRADADLKAKLLGYSTGRLLSMEWGLDRK